MRDGSNMRLLLVACLQTSGPSGTRVFAQHTVTPHRTHELGFHGQS
jgi:hypothetical protein